MTEQAKAAKVSKDEVAEAEAEEIVGAREIGDAELKSIAEALIFVADEPLSAKTIADVLKVDLAAVEKGISELVAECDARNGGLQLREIAGGWQIATRPEHHEQVRAYLKSKPSAKLSLASLETLAVIAYKQPVTVPEILEIRGVQSPSAIKMPALAWVMGALASAPFLDAISAGGVNFTPFFARACWRFRIACARRFSVWAASAFPTAIGFEKPGLFAIDILAQCLGDQTTHGAQNIMCQRRHC